MASARKIKAKAGTMRTPILQHWNEASALEVLRGHRLGDIGDAHVRDRIVRAAEELEDAAIDRQIATNLTGPLA